MKLCTTSKLGLPLAAYIVSGLDECRCCSCWNIPRKFAASIHGRLSFLSVTCTTCIPLSWDRQQAPPVTILHPVHVFALLSLVICACLCIDMSMACSLASSSTLNNSLLWLGSLPPLHTSKHNVMLHTAVFGRVTLHCLPNCCSMTLLLCLLQCYFMHDNPHSAGMISHTSTSYNSLITRGPWARLQLLYVVCFSMWVYEWMILTCKCI